MALLSEEISLYPENLLEEALTGPAGTWWCLYTLARKEKALLRRLVNMNLPCYCPTIRKENRTPAGRITTAYISLFTSYVFLAGDDEARYQALTTGYVSRIITVPDPVGLVRDLARVQQLILSGGQIRPEARLTPGMPIRVKSGPLRGIEGILIQRKRKKRILVTVDFLQQGASMELDEVDVEARDA